MQLSGEKVIKCKANAWLSRCKSACQVGWKETQGKRRGRQHYERRPDKLSSKSSSMQWMQRQRRVEIFVQQVIANLKPESKHQCDCLRKEVALKEVWRGPDREQWVKITHSPKHRHSSICSAARCVCASVAAKWMRLCTRVKPLKRPLTLRREANILIHKKKSPKAAHYAPQVVFKGTGELPLAFLCSVPFSETDFLVHCWSPGELIAKRANNLEGIYESVLPQHAGFSSPLPACSKVLAKEQKCINKTSNYNINSALFFTSFRFMFFNLSVIFEQQTLQTSSADSCVYEAMFHCTMSVLFLFMLNF